MIIVGFDPGFASFGWSVVLLHEATAAAQTPQVSLLACGVIKTKKARKRPDVSAIDDELRRMRELRNGLLSLTYPVHPGQQKDLEKASGRRSRGDRGALFRTALNDADVLTVEGATYGFRNVTTHRQMGYVWGILLSISEEKNRSLQQISAASLKTYITGDAKASKEDVIANLKKRPGIGGIFTKTLKLYPKDVHEHIADAVAVALTGAADIIRETPS